MARELGRWFKEVPVFPEGCTVWGCGNRFTAAKKRSITQKEKKPAKSGWAMCLHYCRLLVLTLKMYCRQTVRVFRSFRSVHLESYLDLEHFTKGTGLIDGCWPKLLLVVALAIPSWCRIIRAHEKLLHCYCLVYWLLWCRNIRAHVKVYCLVYWVSWRRGLFKLCLKLFVTLRMAIGNKFCSPRLVTVDELQWIDYNWLF